MGTLLTPEWETQILFVLLTSHHLRGFCLQHHDQWHEVVELCNCNEFLSSSDIQLTQWIVDSGTKYLWAERSKSLAVILTLYFLPASFLVSDQVWPTWLSRLGTGNQPPLFLKFYWSTVTFISLLSLLCFSGRVGRLWYHRVFKTLNIYHPALYKKRCSNSDLNYLETYLFSFSLPLFYLRPLSLLPCITQEPLNLVFLTPVFCIGTV